VIFRHACEVLESELIFNCDDQSARGLEKRTGTLKHMLDWIVASAIDPGILKHTNQRDNVELLR
jgi:hypothetical protein